jgi:replicative DNA helicase
METLQAILDLSDSQKKLLNENGISSVNAFLDCDEDVLKKVLDTTSDKITEMKIIVEKAFKLKVKKGSELLEEACLRGENFPTRIKNLDEILAAKGIVSGEIIEIIGAPASGKSMLLCTIMINILEHHEHLTMFLIDSKYGFSALKFKNIMDQRNIPEVKQVQMMKRIRVERTCTAEEIIKILKLILNEPRQYDKLKLVAINSMTVPFYLYLGHTLFRLSLMTELTEVMKSLSKQNISVSSDSCNKGCS